jgi:hypothetical protein
VKLKDFMTSISLITILLICTGDLGSIPDTANLKKIDNFEQGNLTLFSQNYSETKDFPNNVFISRIQNTTKIDNLYSKVYGKEKSRPST